MCSIIQLFFIHTSRKKTKQNKDKNRYSAISSGPAVPPGSSGGVWNSSKETVSACPWSLKAGLGTPLRYQQPAMGRWAGWAGCFTSSLHQEMILAIEDQGGRLLTKVRVWWVPVGFPKRQTNSAETEWCYATSGARRGQERGPALSVLFWTRAYIDKVRLRNWMNWGRGTVQHRGGWKRMSG